MESVERAIRSGEAGQYLADHAHGVDDLWLREVPNTGIPYRVYTFFIGRTGYNVMVEEDHLVLLCEGYGAGAIGGFEIAEENGQRVLSYYYGRGSVGSPQEGRYVLGSGQPATW